MPFSANQSVNGSRFPYESCLIPNFPEDVQQQVRAITNFLFVPLDTLLAVLSFITNSLLLTVIIRNRALQHPPQLLLCSLSVTDWLWGLVSLVKNILKMADDDMCLERDNEVVFFSVLCFMSTMGNLAIISRDRYLAVRRPWRYRNHMTRKLVLKKALVAWLYSVVVAVAVYISYGSAIKYRLLYTIVKIFGALFYIICILTMITSYFGIFLANRHHKRNMPQIGASVRFALEREKKLANTIILILLVLVFTFLPALLLPLCLALLGFANGNFHSSTGPLYNVLVTLNGLLNPLLNFGRNKDVRKAVRNLLVCKQRIIEVVPLPVELNSNNNGEENQQNASGSREVTLAQMSTRVKVLQGSVNINMAHK